MCLHKILRDSETQLYELVKRDRDRCSEMEYVTIRHSYILVRTRSKNPSPHPLARACAPIDQIITIMMFGL